MSNIDGMKLYADAIGKDIAAMMELCALAAKIQEYQVNGFGGGEHKDAIALAVEAISDSAQEKTSVLRDMVKEAVRE